jgi:3-phosphoshikimate 1-carboxyvinyltransferase
VFIAASLAEGISVIKNPLTSGDVAVTINILRDLGVKIVEASGNRVIVGKGNDFYNLNKKVLDCKNSGTTLRIFTALALLIEGGLSFTGEFLRRKRPILPLLESLKSLGAEYELSEDKLRVRRVRDSCNTISIRGDISSQFITALLMACPKMKCEPENFITLEITTPLVSYPYIQITLDVLKSFSIKVQEVLNNNRIGKYAILTNQKFRPQVYEIPGDFSSAAFMIVATVLSKEDSTVVINNLNFENPQGDKRIVDILLEMGANIEVNRESNQVIVKGNRVKYQLKGIDIDCHDIPDLFPILAVAGAFTEKTTLYNAGGLRLKESDRISAMARELKKMGVKVEESQEKLTIFRCEDLKGSKIDHENDHRIAMACCVAALNGSSSSQVDNIDIVKDSYPDFIDNLLKLGANIE